MAGTPKLRCWGRAARQACQQTRLPAAGRQGGGPACSRSQAGRAPAAERAGGRGEGGPFGAVGSPASGSGDRSLVPRAAAAAVGAALPRAFRGPSRRFASAVTRGLLGGLRGGAETSGPCRWGWPGRAWAAPRMGHRRPRAGLCAPVHRSLTGRTVRRPSNRWPEFLSLFRLLSTQCPDRALPELTNGVRTVH